MKGIFFKSEFIPAIVEGRKTVTRRVIKPQPDIVVDGKAQLWASSIGRSAEIYFIRDIKPRYQVGEAVYIKEAHYRYGHWNKNGFTKTGRQKWLFKADTTEVRYLENRPDVVYANACKDKTGWFKRSPLFMPQSAARHFIKFKAVRAERLQEITEEDALDEGINEIGYLTFPDGHKGLCFRAGFVKLWDSINKEKWESNPFVFRYEFEYLKQMTNL
jgi:hypothetical protein